MNKQILLKLSKKLSPEEFEKLKSFVFEAKKRNYHRLDLKPIRGVSLGLKRVPESGKMLRTYLSHLMYNLNP